MRESELDVIYSGGWSSSGEGVRYPVVVRNTGSGTFWDVEVRIAHENEETDRKVVRQISPQSETDAVLLLIPARLCDAGTPGIGLRPLGRVRIEALVQGEVVAGTDLEPPEPVIERVPRTADEEAALVRTRPDGWEYLLFASVLRRRMDELEPKYRDHQLRFVRPTGGPVLAGADATEFLSSAFREARVLSDNFNRVFDQEAQERAFGVPGHAGDVGQIEHLASRLVAVYDGLIDWAAGVRGAPIEEEFGRAVELSSRFVDRPIEQFRDFVDRAVAEMDKLPALLRAEEHEPLTIHLTLTIDIEDGLERELQAELRRIEELFAV